MAERRMFSKSVIGSARFLRMPPSSRLLYYDLGMAADDDGVVEAFSVMRMTGAVEDDLKVLVSKGFITVLNEDLVAYIEDWSKNNQIRKDRYQPSIYQNLLVQIGAVNQLETVGQPDGNQRLTQDKVINQLLGLIDFQKCAVKRCFNRYAFFSCRSGNEHINFPPSSAQQGAFAACLQ